ncbi:MAG TPA: DUF4160 domain-containing protein [Gaiellales bacterium]|nr:DUF4160 domain-containing protein [Gaiellales bacterium]
MIACSLAAALWSGIGWPLPAGRAGHSAASNGPGGESRRPENGPDLLREADATFGDGPRSLGLPPRHDVLLRPRPAHFHAEYAEHHAAIVIGSNDVLVGSLPSRALKLVTEWGSLHREELEGDWQRAKDGGSPEPIDPLP